MLGKYAGVLLVLLCFLTKGLCQKTTLIQKNELPFDHLSTRQGLSQATVSSMLQDKDGYMWFATRDGLNKYDGYNFTVYQHNPTNPNSLSGSHTRRVVEDSTGNLWIATNSGLNRFNRKKEIFTAYQHNTQDPNSLSNDAVSAISIDKVGLVWIGTSDGLNVYNPAASRFTRFFHVPAQHNSLIDNDIFDLLLDKSGKLWIGTARGLDKYDPQTNTFTHVLPQKTLSNPDATYKVIELYEDRSGKLWIGVEEEGLFCYNPTTDSLTQFTHNPDDPYSIGGNNITAIFEDSNHQLWVGGWPGGLNLFHPENQRFTVYKHDKDNLYSISDDYVKSIYEDRSGVLWVGTFRGGINMYDRIKHKFSLYTYTGTNPVLTQGQIHALLEDKDGNIWVGSEDIIERIDKATSHKTVFRLSDAPQGLENTTVYSLFQDHSGNIWAGTRGKGLAKFNPDTQSFQWYTHQITNPNSLSNNVVTIIQQDEQGNFWISTSDGLNKFNAVTGQFTNYKPTGMYLNKEGRFSISAIHIGRSGKIWIASSRMGIFSFDPESGRFTHYPYSPDNPLKNPGTFCIYEDAKGYVWIGFIDNVLHRLDPSTRRFSPFATEEGLPVNQVRGILEDNKGNLWLSTRSDGLYKYNVERKASWHYDVYNGLQGDEFLGAFYKSVSGTMYFGGKDGFNVFHPDSIRDNPYAPPVAISSFKVFNTPRAYSNNEIRLGYDENFFSFEFIALSYSSSYKNTFAYKLEGIDDEWVNAGTRRYVSYTNLDPGHYIFRVKAANYDGVWNKEGIAIRLYITPPLWLQKWFQITLLLSVCVCAYIFYHSRIRIMKNRNRQLERVIQLRTEELRHRSLQLEQSLLETQKQQQEAEYQQRRAEEANLLKTELTNLTVHDLKNPLGGIMLYTDLIKDSIHEPEKALRLTQTIREISQGMFYLLSNLLKRAKLESSYISLQKDTIDIMLLVKGVVERNQVKAVYKSQSLYLQEVTGCIVNVDVDLMNDALENLISNAVKFTPAGKNIWVEMQGDATFATITIRDEGTGMGVEEMKRLFTPFQRLSAKPTGNESSTGLGLYIVKKIVELHGGEIKAESRGIGFGSTFTINLPLAHVHGEVEIPVKES